MRKYLNIAAILVIGFVVLGLTVLDSWNYTEYGVTLPFTGLNLKSAPNNLSYGEATVCDNWVFDKVGALHARRGLNQWNNVTRVGFIEYLSNYTDPGGINWYLAATQDTMWLSLAKDGDWTDDEFIGSAINDGTVDFYNASHFVHADAATYLWRTILDDGAGLFLSHSGTDYAIDAIYSDSLIRLDAAFGSESLNQSYIIQQQYGNIQDVQVANKRLYIATDNGLYQFDGNELTSLDDSIGYYKYDLDSCTYEDGIGDGRVRFYLGTWRGTGDAPVFADGSADGLWPIGKYIYFSTSIECFDSASHHATIAGHEITNLWGPIQGIHSTPFAEAPHTFVMPKDDTDYDLLIYAAAPDENYTITFTANIDLDSIAQPYVNGGYERYCKFTPTDSTNWDSTRFASGNWFVTVDGYSAINPIVGNVDSVGGAANGFWAAGHVGWIDLNGKACTAKRYRKQGMASEGLNYTALEVYKDRLWTVVADNPDELRYAPQFFPDSMVNGYQTIGIDLANGDGIMVMHEQHGMMYVFSKNTGHTLAGATVNDFYLRKVLSGVGVAARKAFVAFGQVMFLPHYTGFYLYDGGQLQKISDKIELIVRDSINWAAAEKNMCAAFYDNHIWISYPSGTSGENNRTLVYSVADGRWGNQSFVAGAYHAVTNPADTNEFLIGLVNEGAVCVYEGGTDRDTALQCEYQTGWQDFGTHHVKEIKDYFVTYNKSASCSLVTEFTRNDTLVYADTLGANATTQTLKDKYRNLEAVQSDIYGRYIKLGVNLKSSGGEGWISRLTLGVAHKKQAVHGD